MSGSGVTLELAKRAAQLRYDDLPAPVVTIAKQCLLDWIGVTLAGAREPLVEILGETLEAGSASGVTLIGRGVHASTLDAALINGTASHALDYDDVHWVMQGHPSVPVLPALLAQAEGEKTSGQDLIAAFVAGYEAECAIGAMVKTDHYEAGFHATGTLGTFGAAAACANLMQLGTDVTAHAFSLAGTQAAGLKSMFGTMAKPFHAGKAAQNGLLAARLAAGGFVGRTDILEVDQGFAKTHSTSVKEEAALRVPNRDFYLFDNLFKYHAACYLTHSSIEALKALGAVEASNIAAVKLIVDPGHLAVCNIEEPTTGLETKFSLRHTSALALAGEDTGALETYDDGMAGRDDLVALRRLVGVETEAKRVMCTDVEVAMKDGSALTGSFDSGIPNADLDNQQGKLEQKFRALVVPIVGEERACAIMDAVGSLEDADDVRELVEMLSQ